MDLIKSLDNQQFVLTRVDSVVNFSRWFHRAAGRAASLTAHATRAGKHWFQGIGHSRQVFG